MLQLHTRACTHTYTQLPYIRLLLKWLLMFEFGFEICWYRRYSMWGWDHFKHKTAFPEQNTEKPFPAGIHVCVFLINIHTAWDQLISSDHFLMVGYKALILIFWPLKELKMVFFLFVTCFNVLVSVFLHVYTFGCQSPNLSHPKMISNTCVFLVSAHLSEMIEVDINIAHDISLPEWCFPDSHIISCQIFSVVTLGRAHSLNQCCKLGSENGGSLFKVKGKLTSINHFRLNFDHHRSH